MPVSLGNHVFASSTCVISWVIKGAGDLTLCRCCGFFHNKTAPRWGLAWEDTLPLLKCLPLRICPLLTLASTHMSTTAWRWTSSISKRQLRQTWGNTAWPVNESVRRSKRKQEVATRTENLTLKICMYRTCKVPQQTWAKHFPFWC